MRPDALRVLYVTDSPTVSGAEHVLLSYLERLRKPEFVTHVFLRASNVRLRRELEQRKIAYTATRHFSRKVIRTTMRLDHLCHFAHSFWSVRRELVSLCADMTPHVMHAISYPATLYAALASRAAGVPQIWHEHNIKRIHLFNRLLYRCAASTCSHVIGPSNAVTSALAHAGLEAPLLRTVYNGIDLRRFRSDEREIARIRLEWGLAVRQPMIVLVGQLLPYKGHRTFIEAAPAVLKDHPDARFFIVGALENPRYEAELRRQIRSLELDAAFTFTGWRRDVHAVIGSADVVVVPTLTPEPAALSLMEAMALARPLVATRTGGTPELVTDGLTGLLVSPGNAGELARRVTDLLADRDRARQMGLNGRRVMETRFSEDRHIAEVISLYRESVTYRTRSGVTRPFGNHPAQSGAERLVREARLP